MPWSTGHRCLEEEGKQRISNGSGRSASDVFGYKGTFSIPLPLLTAIPMCWSYSPSTPHNHTSSVYPRTYRTYLHTYALTQFIPRSHFYPPLPLPPSHHPSHTHSINPPLGLPLPPCSSPTITGADDQLLPCAGGGVRRIGEVPQQVNTAVPLWCGGH